MKELVKLVVFVPGANADQIREALGSAGAGQIGEYAFCSYSVQGVGRFVPSANANPHIGSANQPEAVDEERIEVTCQRDQAAKVVALIKDVHPYEEVVVDVYPLLNL